jgi:geranylgeranyl diphosphate synthase, type III
LKQINEILPVKGTKVFTDLMTIYLRGTGMEMLQTATKTCPNRTDYIKYGVLKNFGFFQMQARLVQACGKNIQDFSNFTQMASLFYQVSNDYSDIVVNDCGEGKDFCGDIAEGKFTFPTIHAVKDRGNQEIYGEEV